MTKTIIISTLIALSATAARAQEEAASATAASASAAPSSAPATETVSKPGFEISMSRHELSAALGYQAGFGGDFGSPSGMKLQADYAYRFHRKAWFNIQVGNTFGFGGRDGRCVGSVDSLCYRGGWDLGLAAGVRFKFQTRIPLLIELPVLIGVNVLYNRNCGDNGAAVVLRPGVRAKYFLTPRVGIGAGVNFAFGPAFHAAGSSLCTANAYTDFYGAFDFMLGTEILL